ncbi:MAG: P-type DNA transfer ATPase VirB11 [Acetobacteraceae bacterium]|nr:P-type DNA transfer ATPase VirB11 [Acetobacteraceae bacterium]
MSPAGRPGERTLRILLAPLAGPLADPRVTEVVVNRPGEAGVERRGLGWEWLDLPELDFARLDAVATLAAALSQQDVGPERPLCAATLPDGERVQICRPPAVPAGTVSLTIRRPPSGSPALGDLARGGLFGDTRGGGAAAAPRPAEEQLLALHRAGDWERFFPLAVRARRTVVVAGDTGSGKTSFARALAGLIPADERIVSIEDTSELGALGQRNRVSLFYSKGAQGLARGVGAEELMEAALRMRPDRVLLGELRDGAAFTFVRSVAAGHPGSVTTCHAGSAAGAFDALRLMVKGHGAGRHLLDADVLALLGRMVDVVVHCVREGGRFGVGEVWFRPAAEAAGAARALPPLAAE